MSPEDLRRLEAAKRRHKGWRHLWRAERNNLRITLRLLFGR